MKRLIGLLLTLCASISSAQIVINAGSGGGAATGGITSGAAATGCTAFSIVYVDTSGNLACASTPINGSVSTAGRSILTIRDTISGSSATSNFLNVTGSAPASLTNDTSGIYSTFAASNNAQHQSGIRSIITGTGGAGKFTTSFWGESQASGPSGIGLLGTVSSGAPTYGVGVYGTVLSGTGQAAGYFTLGAEVPTGATAAVVANNAAVAAAIIDARDNGVSVWSVADNGYIQGTMGEVALNANYTNATAGFTSTALSVAVVSGRTYSFDLNLMFADSTAADGAQFDFNGGSAAATNFDVHCTAANNVGAALAITNAASTTLATAVQVALALTTQAALTCHGSFVPSGSGTFIVRGAQTAHTAGTLTINRGSSLSVRDARPL